MSTSATLPSELITTLQRYCKCIYELDEDGIVVIQARIAERLGVTRPIVTHTTKRLLDHGLITVTKRSIALTAIGVELAEELVRRHRLAERFLADQLQVPWAMLHHEATRWEHAISDTVEQALDTTLGHPATCPHGNPIPGRVAPAPPSCPLVALRPGDHFTVVRVPVQLEFVPGLLEFLQSSSLMPGRSGAVTTVAPDGTVTVTAAGRDVGVGAEASARILVTPTSPGAASNGSR